MKHLMRYEGFSSQERLDEILDKISKYGIDSISNDESTPDLYFFSIHD